MYIPYEVMSVCCFLIVLCPVHGILARFGVLRRRETRTAKLAKMTFTGHKTIRKQTQTSLCKVYTLKMAVYVHFWYFIKLTAINSHTHFFILPLTFCEYNFKQTWNIIFDSLWFWNFFHIFHAILKRGEITPFNIASGKKDENREKRQKVRHIAYQRWIAKAQRSRRHQLT